MVAPVSQTTATILLRRLDLDQGVAVAKLPAHSLLTPRSAAAQGRVTERPADPIPLAGLTALFMTVGYLIGAKNGAMIALVIAAATNVFTYRNSDRMVLSTYGAHDAL